MSNLQKENILLIDGFNIVIAQNSVANIVDANSEPIGTYLSTVNQVRNFIEIFKPIKVFFVMDGPNAGERRRKIYPNYKGKRRVKARTSKVKLSEGDEEESYEVDGAFENQLQKIFEFLKSLPITVCIVPFCEADDIITHIAKKNQDKYRSVIVSTDKDYLQLVNENINVYNWRKKTVYDSRKFIEDHKILPSNYIYKKIIRGDSSDEIKGVSAIGDKTFERIFSKKLFEDEVHEIGDFFNFINSIDKELVEKKDKKHIDKLNESETQKELLKKFQIMKLDDDYLKTHHLEILRKQIEEQKNKVPSYLTLQITLMKESFNKVYGAYSQSFNPINWLRPFKIIHNQIDINI